MKKRNVLLVAGIIAVVVIGIVIVKIRTDNRTEAAREARSQEEKDAEALDDKINNPQTAEDYYEAFLAGKMTASTKKSGVSIFSDKKTISFEDMKGELISMAGWNAWPSELQMCSYSMFTPEGRTIPDLLIRFHFVFSYNEQTYDEIAVIRYIGKGNLRLICELAAPNVKTDKSNFTSEIKVLKNGLIEETIYYNDINGMKDTTYYNLCTEDKEIDCIANIMEFYDFNICSIPSYLLPEGIAGEDYVEPEFLDDTDVACEGYKLQIINTDYTNRSKQLEFYKQNAFYIFRDSNDESIYPADSENIALYETNGLNLLTGDKANTFIKDLFKARGFDYDTCFDEAGIEWIDIECPPWGPYNVD